MHNKFLSLRAHVKLRVEHQYSNGPICFLATKTSGREALNHCCLGCRCRQREACVLIVEAQAFLHVWWHRRNNLAVFDVMWWTATPYCFSILFSRNTTLRFSFIKDWIRFEKRGQVNKNINQLFSFNYINYIYYFVWKTGWELTVEHPRSLFLLHFLCNY